MMRNSNHSRSRRCRSATRLWLLLVPALLWNVVTATVTEAATNLVVNGGFETGDFTGWQTLPALTGSDFFVAPADSHAGSFAAWFSAQSNQVDTITQTFSTTPGQNYQFTFYLQNAAIDVPGAPTNYFTAAFNGTTVLSLTNMPGGGYQQYTFTNQALSTSLTIKFAGYNQTGASWNLDDVAVTPLPTMPVVPEPSVFSLVALGVLLALRARPRR